eukprot:maker-scaffold249_size238305-snap-gene-0.14 protein:Tk01317 transcript:maker-scaffold249_size238305-snap-gene-0.14-mRNA-1 annotation:"hypothetical protein LOTGIDRAFT_112601"
MSPEALQRLNRVIDLGKTAFHWGFLPTILYLGFAKGSEPGMPDLTLASLLLQLTLAIIKPDISRMTFSVLKIREMMLDHQFLVVRTKKMAMTRPQAEQFYGEHEGKFFFNRLVTFMSSGPIFVHVLAKNQAIQDWRTLMGPTKVFKTRFEQPETIRGRFGLTDTRNCSHGSDSEDNARQEIQFFFPDFSVDDFLAHQEPAFRSGHLIFDRIAFVHRPQLL